jgi:hypothetical protein
MIAKLRVHCANWARQEGRWLDEGLDAKRLKVEESASVASADAQLSCPWIGRLETLEAHRKECHFELVACQFPACGAKMVRRDLPEHLSICRFALRACELGCEASVVRFGYEEHLLACPERQARGDIVCVCVCLANWNLSQVRGNILCLASNWNLSQVRGNVVWLSPVSD